MAKRFDMVIQDSWKDFFSTLTRPQTSAVYWPVKMARYDWIEEEMENLLEVTHKNITTSLDSKRHGSAELCHSVQFLHPSYWCVQGSRLLSASKLYSSLLHLMMSSSRLEASQKASCVFQWWLAGNNSSFVTDNIMQDITVQISNGDGRKYR